MESERMAKLEVLVEKNAQAMAAHIKSGEKWRESVTSSIDHLSEEVSSLREDHIRAKTGWKVIMWISGAVAAGVVFMGELSKIARLFG